ncbi:MAG: hypothetical protein AAF127_06255 [Pseudomonadota bacterium]
MANIRMALLWAFIILAAAVVAGMLDLPPASKAILITTLTAAAVASINTKRTRSCAKC